MAKVTPKKTKKIFFLYTPVKCQQKAPNLFVLKQNTLIGTIKLNIKEVLSEDY